MNETIRTINELRSIRKFTKKEISKNDLNLILESCVKAATASARQTYSVIVIEDKSHMKKLGYVGSKMLIFCLDFNRLLKLADFMGYNHPSIECKDFVTGSTDTILAAQTAAIAAKSLGIDSLYSNCIHRCSVDDLFEILDLPEKYCFPIIALVLGYSEKPQTTNKGRLYRTGVIHFGKYQKLTDKDKEDIKKEYDNPEKQFLSFIRNWKQKGYKHYLDCFFKEWCGYSKKNENRLKEIKSVYKIEKLIKKTGYFDSFGRNV